MHHVVLTRFKEFLLQATGFYLDLIAKIHARFGVVEELVIYELSLVLEDHAGIDGYLREGSCESPIYRIK